ncbi:hypothetical protein OH77DRAFT_357676 [Trametes cingulata]|nr:hypothetical protein OH77DRAFT_357676 [Trametes cingulata]
MNAGARHDALNSVFNFWNWQKTVNMGKFLARKLREAYALQRRTTRYFASLTVIARPEVVTEWLKIDLDDDAPTPLTFREKTKNWAKSVYLLDHIAGTAERRWRHGGNIGQHDPPERDYVPHAQCSCEIREGRSRA